MGLVCVFLCAEYCVHHWEALQHNFNQRDHQPKLLLGAPEGVCVCTEDAAGGETRVSLQAGNSQDICSRFDIFNRHCQ